MDGGTPKNVTESWRGKKKGEGGSREGTNEVNSHNKQTNKHRQTRQTTNGLMEWDGKQRMHQAFLFIPIVE